jgi:predicted cobalt transporter CbtA
MDGQTIMAKIVSVIINPLILMLFSVGFVLFLWGLVVFMANAENSSERSTGIQHMIWGIAGMFVMVSAYGIIQLVLNTLGISLPRI